MASSKDADPSLDYLTHTKASYPFEKFELGSFVGSCNGLACLEHSRPMPVYNWNMEPGIVVWNPFTGLYRTLPDHDCCFHLRYARGFGYDSASDDYKVFFATCHYNGGGNRVDIFSLRDGSWKGVENPARELQHLIRRDSMGLFLNGALHWEFENGKDGLTKIIAFDLAKETFYDVSLPLSGHHQLSPLNYGYEYYTMGVVGEYLCICFFATDHDQEGLRININVWVMKEYCNEASWVHCVSYTPNRLFDDATYVPNSIPRSAKDVGYIILQYSRGCIDVLELIDNNPDEGSDETEGQYSNKIRFFYRLDSFSAIPYTEALTSPYLPRASIDQGILEHSSQAKPCLLK
ncbi:hypothetical protein Tsubulata_029505 [Turnera subulata]|uniref:F-box associated beta-propeller type 1 domain-containing protein n=1 Tax=Turnera subulata TaxID=218843 RepID=A0A9Q0FYG9_9ROSI|nr:hypothetical protein Tsubulata_029505 [Turnera subulata]